MADDGVSTDEKVRRGVARTLGNFALFLVLIGLGVVWAATGYYELRQAGGEAALILRFGEYQRTETQPGWHLHLPQPIETRQVVRMDELQSVEFGGAEPGAETEELTGDLVVQTQLVDELVGAFDLDVAVDPARAADDDQEGIGSTERMERPDRDVGAFERLDAPDEQQHRNVGGQVDRSASTAAITGSEEGPFDPGRDDLDLSLWIEVGLDTLRERLMQRWLGYGFSQQQANDKVELNDLPNARYVLDHSRSAHGRLIGS